MTSSKFYVQSTVHYYVDEGFSDDLFHAITFSFITIIPVQSGFVVVDDVVVVCFYYYFPVFHEAGFID